MGMKRNGDVVLIPLQEKLKQINPMTNVFSMQTHTCKAEPSLRYRFKTVLTQHACIYWHNVLIQRHTCVYSVTHSLSRLLIYSVSQLVDYSCTLTHNECTSQE